MLFNSAMRAGTIVEFTLVNEDRQKRHLFNDTYYGLSEEFAFCASVTILLGIW